MNYDLKRPLNELFSAGNQLQKYGNIKSEHILGSRDRVIPKYTILIPTYGRPEQLMEAVQSAINQTIEKSKYDILVVDNEYNLDSLTNTKLKELNIENLFYYQNSFNLGAGGNWNRGFELARSKWICMLHDDDILYPHALKAIEATLSLVDKDKTAAISPGFDYAEQVSGEWVCKGRPKLRFWRKSLQNRLVRRSLLRLQLGLRDDPVAPTCGVLFNRQAVLGMGGFPDHYKSDDMFFAFALSDKYLCYSTRQIWGQYRWGSNDSLDEQTKVELIKEALLLNEYYFEFPLQGILPMIERWFRKKLRYLICIKPVLESIPPVRREAFKEKYLPEWRTYKPTHVEQIAFKTRHLIAWVIDMATTILSTKVSGHVKN